MPGSYLAFDPSVVRFPIRTKAYGIVIVLSINYYGCGMVTRGVACRVMKLLTTKDAAKKLGVSDGRVRAMIIAGRLPAEKFGRAHLIREADLKLVRNRKPGRPRTKKPATKSGELSS